MATKKKTTALANKSLMSMNTIDMVRRSLLHDTGLLAQAFSPNNALAPTEVAAAYETLYTVEKALERTMSMAKAHLVTLLKQQGEKVTDAGTLRMEYGGFTVEARPTRTGYDPKKLEALLSAKGQPLNRFMEQRVTYAVSDDGIKRALEQRVLTTAELDTVKYGESFSLQPLKPVGGDEG